MDPRSACAASTMPPTTVPMPGEPDATPTIPAAATRWRSTGRPRCGSRSTCCATTRRLRVSTVSVSTLPPRSVARDRASTRLLPCLRPSPRIPCCATLKFVAEPWDVGRRRLSPGARSPQTGASGTTATATRAPILAWRCRHGGRTRDAHCGLVRRLRPAPATADMFGQLRRRPRRLHARRSGRLRAQAQRGQRRDNRDGTDRDLSWNHGVEGATDDPGDRGAAASDVRSLLATLFVSRGTPMLAMGDERAARRTATTTPTRRTTRRRGSTGRAPTRRRSRSGDADGAAAAASGVARGPVAHRRAGRWSGLAGRRMAASRWSRDDARRLGASARGARSSPCCTRPPPAGCPPTVSRSPSTRRDVDRCRWPDPRDGMCWRRAVDTAQPGAQGRIARTGRRRGGAFGRSPRRRGRSRAGAIARGHRTCDARAARPCGRHHHGMARRARRAVPSEPRYAAGAAARTRSRRGHDGAGACAACVARRVAQRKAASGRARRRGAQ